MVRHTGCYWERVCVDSGLSQRPACTLGWERDIMSKGRVRRPEEDPRASESSPGIVVTNGRVGFGEEEDHPRIAAFIWGGKVRPNPTLPFGRWKGAA